MAGSIRYAEELAAGIEGAVIAGQFVNPENPEVHFRTTGPELYRDADGEIDLFVAGVGTGGTVSGVGRYLKSVCRDIRVVGVEPAASPVLSGGTPGPHGLQGIGAGFVPKTLDVTVLDEVMTVTQEEAVRFAHLLARTEGILVGFSGGAALAAAARLLERPTYRGKTVATVLPDTGERYLSTLYADYETATPGRELETV
jgi:cysteine synthase A